MVEDEPLLLMHIADELVKAGFDVVESPNADHALRRISIDPTIDILFTDVDMPGSMDGVALSEIVSHQRPDMVIVMTSGETHEELAAVKEGVAFIPKPYVPAELVEVINAALGE
ncbi:MAG: response regulator [Rhizobiaceae bacterium]|nr:response regulator [Rhizobiaceae bacterium]